MQITRIDHPTRLDHPETARDRQPSGGLTHGLHLINTTRQLLQRDAFAGTEGERGDDQLLVRKIGQPDLLSTA